MTDQLPKRLGIIQPEIASLEAAVEGDDARTVLRCEWTGNELVVGPEASIRALMDAGWIVPA